MKTTYLATANKNVAFGGKWKKINKSIMFLSVHYHKLKIKQQTSFIYLKKKKENWIIKIKSDVKHITFVIS